MIRLFRRAKKYLPFFSVIAFVFTVFIYSNRDKGIDDFYRITKEDPLFTSVETDCKEISGPIGEIKELNGEIIERKGLKDNIVPVDFLSSLCIVDEAHRNFLESKNSFNARKVISAYENTQDAYESEVLSLKRVLGELLVEDDLFVTATTFATREMIMEDIDLMIKNAIELKNEVKFRRDVLKGTKKYESIKSFIYLPDIGPEKRIPPLLDEEELFYPREYTEFEGVYTANTSCFDYPEEEDYFYVYRNLRNGKIVFNLKLATNNHYSRHGRHSELANYLNLLPKEGYVYVPAKETNIYNCRDVDYQFSIMTMHLFLEKYGNRLIFNNIFNDRISSVIKKSANVERVVLSREIPSESEFSLLGNHYLNGYLLLRENDQYENQADEMLNRYLMITNKTRGLEMILNTTLFLDVIKTDFDRGNRPDIVDLYAIRSNYSVSFLNFSPAVWRIKEKPKYGKSLDSMDMKKEIPFSEYDKLVDIYGRETVLYWNENTSMTEWHDVIIDKLTNLN